MTSLLPRLSRLDLEVHHDSDTPVSHKGLKIQDDEPMANVRSAKEIAIELIQTYDKEFGKDPEKKQVMWRLDQPLHQFGDGAHFKMKKTLAKVVVAAIGAFSNCPDDFGAIWGSKSFSMRPKIDPKVM